MEEAPIFNHKKSSNNLSKSVMEKSKAYFGKKDNKMRKRKPYEKKSQKHKKKEAKKAKEQIETDEEEKQCLGPQCCKAALPRSRYCSDTCGIALARKRIVTFLPERKSITEGWAKSCDEQLIAELEEQQKVAHQRVEELQNQRVVVMKLIEKAKAVNYEEKENDEDMSDEEGENEFVDCVTCGMACSTKNAVKHMERCYSKFEAQLSLGSTVRCDTEWENPVCDTYDRQQGAYCKKLRVLCPDHNREKEEHDGICGCPLEFSVLTEDVAVCGRSKRTCTRHISWEKLLLAEIDMERVQQCLKLEDSFENTRKVKYRIMNRKNLLQILLNGTISH